MIRSARHWIGLLALPAALCAHAQSPDFDHGLQLFTENDFFSRSKTDQWYTNGLRVVYLPSEQSPLLVDFKPLAERFYGKRTLTRLGFTLGQDIYTPRDISRVEAQTFDRPWAGWTYIGVIAQAASADVQDTVELNLGAVGPAAGAESVQRRWHRLIGADEPRGWRNQIRNELGLNLTWRHQVRHQYLCNQADWIPHFGIALGNIMTYAAAGGTLRVGQNISGFGDDRGATSLRRGGELAKEQCAPPAPEALEWYLYTRAEGRLVARNIFLDGNTFRNGPKVTKHPWVYDLALGASVRFLGNFRVTFTQTWRRMEFKAVDERTPRGVHRFGTIVLAYEY